MQILILPALKNFFLGETFLCKEKYGFHVNCLKCLVNPLNRIEYKLSYKGFICQIPRLRFHMFGG